MAGYMKSKFPATTTNYVDFEPLCELKEENNLNTLVILLPGFKKEQLRVQVRNLKTVKVSGEKPEGANYRRRFVKETKLPANCNINEIRAKFSDGELRITMPIKVPTIPQLPPQPKQEKASSTTPRSETGEPPNADVQPSEPVPEQTDVTQSIAGCRGAFKSYYDRLQDKMYGLRSLLIGSKKKKVVVITVGILVVLGMIGIGIYVFYKLGALHYTFSSL